MGIISPALDAKKRRPLSPPMVEKVEAQPLSLQSLPEPEPGYPSLGPPPAREEPSNRLNQNLAATITAESTPLDLRRLESPDFTMSHLREGVRSGNAGIRRIALREMGVPEDVQDMVSGGSRIPRPVTADHSKDGHRSLAMSVLHHLEHAGKGFLAGLSTGNPIAAIVGAGIGAASPAAADRAYFRTLQEPEWLREKAIADEDSKRRIERAKDYASISGRDPLTGEFTPTGARVVELSERNDQLARDSAARIAQGDARVEQGQARLDQAERRAQIAERNARLNQILSAGRIPGRQFTDKAKSELEQVLGVQLPDQFNPQTHDIKQAEDGSYQIISIDRQTGASEVQPVTTRAGQRLVGPKKGESAASERGRAALAILQRQGINDINQMVDNPAFQEAFSQERRIADERAKGLGNYTPPSDSEIAARVQKKFKLAPKVPAHKLISQRELDIEIARQRGGASPSKSTSVDQKAMAADEQLFQQEYGNLTDEQRKLAASEFKRRYGRAPKAP